MIEKLESVVVPVIVTEEAHGLELPVYSTALAAGADLCSAENVTIKPGDVALVSTGMIFQIPEGYEMQIRPRSGIAFRNHVTVLNSPGTIDADYDKAVSILLINHGKSDFVIKRGDRIAQAVMAPVSHAWFKVTDIARVNDRIGGFGSTGV